MRSRVATLVAVPLLLLAIAAPAAAAGPYRASGTAEWGNAWAGQCTEGRTTTCTDVYLDVFDQSDWAYACINVDRYSFNGDRFRFISHEDGCTGSLYYNVSDDMSGASLLADIQLYSCDANRCRATDQVTVDATFTGVGDVTAYSGRGRFTDGGCTFRYSFTGERRWADVTISVADTAYTGSGEIAQEEVTTTQSCR